MKIKVHTSFVGSGGYNNHAQDFFTELSKIIKLKIRNFTIVDKWDDNNPHKTITDYQKTLIGEQTFINNDGFYDVEIFDGLSDIEDYDIDLVLNETRHSYFYDMSKFKGKYKIAFNVWESTRQPTDFFKVLLQYDQLWVPTEWQKQVSIEQGYPEEKIQVVPEAVNINIFNTDRENLLELDEYKDNRFKFLLFGRWDYRKSTEEIIKTFLKTFNKNEPVDLILSIDNGHEIYGLKTTEERLKYLNIDDDRLKILHFPDREDYITYLKNGHVFLSCARSEGWNLPLIEAMACGTPSIYSNWGGQLEFAKNKGLPVKIIGEKEVNSGDDFSFNTANIGKYCEPDFNDLSIVMRDAYKNFWKYKLRAIKEADTIKEKFNWKIIASDTKKILENFLEKQNNYNKNVSFITGGDEKFIKIIEPLIKSLNTFSNIPIIVYGFNCDVPYTYPNMEKRRLNINRKKIFNDRDTRPYYYKIDASIDSINQDNSKTYIWIDSDCIVTHNIDNILKYTENIENFPVCMTYKETLIHYREKNNKIIYKYHGEELSNLLNIDRFNDFSVATGLYIYNDKSKWFFEEVLEHHERFLKDIDASDYIDDMALAEERLFNVLYWKYAYTKDMLPITWETNNFYNINKDNKKYIPKIENTLKGGFDIMYEYTDSNELNENNTNILFYHGQKNIDKAEEQLNNVKETKLMIVAHPDDELIFGGGKLLTENGWKVIVVTSGNGDNNNSKERLREFKQIASKLNFTYELLNFDDDLNNIPYDEDDVKKKLIKIIFSKKWDIILTHNNDGEYGHIIHKSINNILRDINPNNLYFFNKSQNKLNNNIIKHKLNLLKLYKSQNTNLDSLTEYIEYESIIKNTNTIIKFDNYSAYIEINEPGNDKYTIDICNNKINETIYKATVNTNSWVSTNNFDKQIDFKISNTNEMSNETINYYLDLNNKYLLFNWKNKMNIKNNYNIIKNLINKYNIIVDINIDNNYTKNYYNNINNSANTSNGYYIKYNFNEDDDLSYIFEDFL